jgi:hypothetical protein
MLLDQVLEALQLLSGPELELKTSALIEELRFAGQTNRAELARGLASLASTAELQTTSDQRRALARFLDVAVELGGVDVCSLDCCSLLLKSVSGVAAKSESVVASEVLLGILGANSSLAWDVVWSTIVGDSKRGTKAILQLMVEALERFPQAALPRICALVQRADSAAQRMIALELLCLTGSAGPVLDADLALDAVVVVAKSAKVEKEAGVFNLTLLALAGLLRSVTRQMLKGHLGLVMECVERALTWTHRLKAAIHSTAVSLFFCVYAALPVSSMKRLHDFSERSPVFAAAARSLLATRCIPLHENLLLGTVNDEENLADDGVIVDDCWGKLLAKSVVLPVGRAELEPKKHDDEEVSEWKSELECLETKVCELALSAESLCARVGVCSFSGVGTLSPVDTSNAQELLVATVTARIQVVFEKLICSKVLMHSREGLIVRGFGQIGAQTAGGSGNATSATEHDTTDTSADENDQETTPTAMHARSGATILRLKDLLSAAQAELALRDQLEEGLRKRSHHFEEELRAEQTRRKASVQSVPSHAEAELVALSERQEQRISELEVIVRMQREQLHDQQQFEAELSALQLDVMEWDDRDAQLRAQKRDGSDLESQLAAARIEMMRLEEVHLEQQAHYEQALSEVAGLTVLTNTAMTDTLRTEREIEEMRRTLAKMADVYQERIAAVEDKYASLQELHAGLMLEFSRRK